MQKWKIEIYEGDKQVLGDTTGAHGFSKDQMIALLQRLASRDLPEHEIINASRVPNSVGYSNALVVKESLGGKLLTILTDVRKYHALLEGI